MTDHAPAALTLRQVIEQSAARFPERPAVSDLGEEPLSYREFHESVQGLSHWLSEQGIVFGDTVAILAENSSHWAIAYFAITSMGAVAVPILIEFHSDAIVHIIRHSEAKAVFVSEKLFPKIADAVFDPSPLFISLESFSPISQGMTRDTLKDLKSKGLRVPQVEGSGHASCPQDAGRTDRERSGRHHLYFGHHRALQRGHAHAQKHCVQCFRRA